MARVKAEYQQILYEVEVICELCRHECIGEEVQEILALTNVRLQTIQDILKKWGDTESIEEIVRRVFDKLYKNNR